jgi:hypothetical protein
MAVFLYAQNYELVELHMIYRTLIYGFIVSCGIYAITYFFIKEKTKTGIITSIMILTLFNYGVIYDFAESMYYKELWPFKSIHRYLLVLLFFVMITLIFLIKNKIKIGQRINYFLNLLVIFLLCFNTIKIVFLKTYHSNTLISSINNTNEIRYKTNKKLPSIYYMILDGYANEHILSKYYHFNNEPFINFLKQKHFYVADSSFSNYYFTSTSLSATLNMAYHNDTLEPKFDKLRNNKVFSELKRYGYKTYRLQSGYAVTSGLTEIDSVITIKAPNEFERSILKYTICRLDDIFGFIPYIRLKSQIKKLDDIELLANVSPKFVFIHIVAPHPPFVFNEKGERTFSKKDNDNSWEPKEKYIAQLSYINTIAKSFIQNITVKDPKAIFILQSDHGPYITSKNTEDVFKARSMILNAIKYPDTFHYKSLYRGISSVNTFRSVFNLYIDSSYHLIPDLTAGRKDLEASPVFKSKVIY